jgi:hypothetical protein
VGRQLLPRELLGGADDEHLGILVIHRPVSGGASLVNHRREERGKEMTITRHPAGVEVSDIIGGYRVSELYVGYSIQEARARFRDKYPAE